MDVFDVVTDFPIIIDPSGRAPGNKWMRPSYFGLGHFKVKVNEYYLWRIMDGDMEIDQRNFQGMEKKVYSSLHLARYSNDCLEKQNCIQDTGGSCNVFGCSNSLG